MSQYAMLAADVVAVLVLVFALFVPRHGRRELVVAFLGVNVGVVAVTAALASGTVGAGLGLGLFGVLSIIRLRSNALTQEEVAYYFAALALGLIAGLRPDPLWVAPVTTVLIVAVMYVADHPGIYARARHQTIVLDAAITDEGELRERLGRLLDAEVTRVFVTETDLVRDITVVDVRYTIRPPVEEHAYEASPAPVEAVPAPAVALR